MAKDPAILWYWNDWYSATSLYSRFLKGCYMDLLHAQFNNGRLSIEEIKICLGADFGSSWPTLQKKFKQDQKGLFFNERLEDEKNKRQAFSESRRANVNKRYSTYEGTSVAHMGNHMENRNENVLEEKKGSEKKETFCQFPNEKNFSLEIPETKIAAAIEFQKISKGVDVSQANALGLWNLFKQQHFTGKKFYADVGDIYSHFINWFKSQNLNQNGKKQKDTGDYSVKNIEEVLKKYKQ